MCALQPLTTHLADLMRQCGVPLPAMEFPPLKPSKKLEAIWKTLAKHFAMLELSDRDIMLNISTRRDAPPVVSFEHSTHASITLERAYQLLPKEFPPESQNEDLTFKKGWAIRSADFLHLFYSLTPDALQRLEARVEEQRDLNADEQASV